MKTLRGYNGLYSITEDGYVVSHRKKRIMKGRPLPNGYLRVILVDRNGKRKDCLVHRLVCETFHGADSKHLDVNHKNGLKYDNRAENLEWCTKQENMTHASANGYLKPQSDRMKEYNVENCSIPVVAICTLTGKRTEYPSMAMTVVDGFSQPKVSLCVNGKRRTHKGHKWERL